MNSGYLWQLFALKFWVAEKKEFMTRKTCRTLDLIARDMKNSPVFKGYSVNRTVTSASIITSAEDPFATHAALEKGYVPRARERLVG
ncbi:hypothetical protein SAMN02787142_4918 [Burkholderia sp. WP9]|uniref:hypothetical protein n=1 Tax=Burkholderia sp. WP9 TaxID=1500263 RepID=UPI00089C1BAF|nr:hypothetical protein [Burkholderia sp. WP9]SEE84019.1 hypothetical protein SAMN02787142_4918 [Burkholderia sp. WP9]